jgi:integrase
MSVRRRQWISPSGESKEAWIVDYRDQHGSRHIKTFAKKRDADTHHALVAVGVRAGTHTAESRSGTVAEAGKLWLASGKGAGLERATLDAYEQHLELHIVPLIGGVKLAQLTAPLVRTFEDRLREDRSPAMVRKVLRSLGAILADAQERGLVAQNVVHSLVTNDAAGNGAPSGGRAGGSRSAWTSRRRTRSRPSSPSSKGHGGRCC